MRITDLNDSRVISIDASIVETTIPHRTFINGCVACFRSCSAHVIQQSACYEEEDIYGKVDNYFINRVKEACAQ